MKKSLTDCSYAIDISFGRIIEKTDAIEDRRLFKWLVLYLLFASKKFTALCVLYSSGLYFVSCVSHQAVHIFYQLSYI